MSAITVGQQATSIVLPADFSEPPTSQHHTVTESYLLPLPSHVTATLGGTIAVSDIKFEVNGGTAIVVSPKVARNARCPCGSDLKYKRCCSQRH